MFGQDMGIMTKRMLTAITLLSTTQPHTGYTQGGRGNLIEPPPHTNLPTGRQRRVLAGGGRCQGPGTHNI